MDASDRLIGLVTDGDVRRALQAHDDIRGLRASAVMTPNPSFISPDARLQDALRLMEDRPSQISVLPVLDPASGVCLGLLRLHDIYRRRHRKPAPVNNAGEQIDPVRRRSVQWFRSRSIIKCGVGLVVGRQPSKLIYTGSNPVPRSRSNVHRLA